MITFDFLDISREICGNREAVVFEDRRYSYEELYSRVCSVALSMEKLGVRKGTKVGMLNVNCSEYVESYFASSMLGAIFVPLNYRAKEEELRYMINTAEIELLLVGERYVDMVENVRDKLSTVRTYVGIGSGESHAFLSYEKLLIHDRPKVPVPESVEEDDVTVLMFTSGTTGRPKVVPLKHRSFVAYALTEAEPADPDRAEKCLLAVPFYHVMGFQSLLISIYSGRTVVLMRQFETEEWFRIAEKEGIERTILVPTMLKRIVDEPNFSRYDLSSLRVITYGAAPMPFEVIKKAIEFFPSVSFFNGYGQTETAATLTVLGPEDHRIVGTDEEKAKKWRRLKNSIGKPLPDVKVRIVGEDGSILSPYEVGEIQVKGPRVMDGYWKDEQKSLKVLTEDGWLKTGDMGYVDEEGYLYITGRVDDLIIRGGENISPEEVEGVINSHPKVEESAVCGVPDPEFGQQPFAFCVLKKGEIADEDEIIEYCRERLSPFKRPRGVIFVDSLPRSPMGKILRRKLVEEFERMKRKEG